MRLMLLIPSLAFIAGLLYVPAVAADETGRAFGISNGKAAGAFHQPALVVPSKKMATFEVDDAAISVRGGGDDDEGLSLAQKYLTFSAAMVSTLGLLAMFSWDTITSMFSYLRGIEGTRVNRFFIGSAHLGWGAGKATAVLSGTASTKKFCQLNCVPMAATVYMAFAEGMTRDLILQSIFFLIYAYFGFVE